ncbi:TetR/AcrR family transcriptional regulator [Inquilinus sp. KBS0705]|nr:TetR/AcrR family transcriptional regulator [Inquilinus sp. KBS0705]
MSKAATTRLMILQKSFDLIYKNGYQATSIDNILATTKVTKGAFFYHFKNKDEMGLAMINEIIYPGMYGVLVKPLLEAHDPISDIYEMMRNALLKVPFLRARYGCPAINLLEEMAPGNDVFKTALLKLTDEWQQAIEAVLNEGSKNGAIAKGVNAAQVAFFVISGYSGIRSMGKALGTACYAGYLQEFKNYLQGLA